MKEVYISVDIEAADLFHPPTACFFFPRRFRCEG